MYKYLCFFFIAQISIAQTVSTFFSNASLEVDDAMVFDAEGNLYGSNFAGNTVYKITPAGVATPFVTGLQNPNGLAFDDDGNLYVAEYSAMQINKYDSDGNFLDMYPTGGLTSGLIKDVNSPGLVFTNVTDDSVNILSLDGTITPIFQGAPLIDPVGLTFNQDGVLFVANFTGRAIHRVSSGNATFVATIPDGGASSGNAAVGFITYAAGRLYATNFGGHELYVVNPDGVDDFELYGGGDAGDDDGPIATATFDTPNGIIYNSAQNAFYISEFSGDGNIRKIDNAVLGIAEVTPISVSIYPNPVSDVLTIQSNGLLISEMCLFDISGKRVLSMKPKFANTVSSINCTVLKSGSYFLQLKTKEGIVVKKVLKL